MPKDHNSDKNQSSMISIYYDHLQEMGTITKKFHQNPFKTVGGVAETRLCLQMDGLTDGQTHYYSPLRVTSWDNDQVTVHDCVSIHRKSRKYYTVKILKFGTPQTIAIIVLKIEKFDVTLQ